MATHVTNTVKEMNTIAVVDILEQSTRYLYATYSTQM